MKNNIIYGGINGSISRISFFIFQFLTHLLLANYLGNKNYGIYQLSISIVLIFSIFGNFGLPKVALKFIPSYLDLKQIDKLKGLLLWSCKRVLIFSACSILVLQLIIPFLNQYFFFKNEIISVIRITSLSIVCINFIYLFSSWGLALNNQRIENIFQLFFQPFLYFISVLCYGLFSGFILELNILSILYLFSWFCTLIIILFKEFFSIIKKYNFKKNDAQYEIEKWLSFGIPIFSYDMVHRMGDNIGIILAGIFLVPENLGSFSLYTRLSNMPNMVVLSFSRIFSGIISTLYNKKEFNTLAFISNSIRNILIYIGVIVVFIMVINNQIILSFFGYDYLIGSNGFIIMLFATFFNFYFGTSDYLLIFSGGEKKVMLLSLVKLIFSIILSYILMPILGLLGACIALAVPQILHRIIILFYINKIFKMKYLVNQTSLLILIIFLVIFYFLNSLYFSDYLYYSIIHTLLFLIIFNLICIKKYYKDYQKLMEFN